MVNRILQIACLAAVALSISGCLAAAAGAGAVGGYEFNKHYKVEKK